MKYYRLLSASEDYRTLGLSKDNTVDILNVRSLMRQPSRIDCWVSPKLQVVKKRLPEPSIPIFLGTGLVFSHRAYEIMREPLSSDGEFLVLDVAGGQFHLFHVMKCLDCLDQNRRPLRHHPGANDYSSLDLKEEMLVDTMIFRIPQVPMDVFATEHFDLMMVKNHLRGYRLLPLN